MHLERPPVTGTGDVPLPASEAMARLGSGIFGRWALGLRGIPGGDVAALRSEVGCGLCGSRDGSWATGMGRGERTAEVGCDLWRACVDRGQSVEPGSRLHQTEMTTRGRSRAGSVRLPVHAMSARTRRIFLTSPLRPVQCCRPKQGPSLPAP